VLLSRLPFVTHLLWQWDSVLYARALEEGFHVDDVLRDARPHPPGYLFYVALAAVFRFVLQDSNASLVAVSVLASALAVPALFLLARRFAGDAPAAIAAAGFAFSPLVWLYGEVAYPYALLGLLSVVLAAVFSIARTRPDIWRVGASLLFGIAAGFRQDVLIVFGPLWLWTIWRGSLRSRSLSAFAVAIACLAWFVPSATLSGGLTDYVESLGHQTSSVGSASSIFEGGLAAVSDNARFILYGLAFGLLAFAVLLAGLALTRVVAWMRGGPRRVRWNDTDVFFVLWIVPPLLFYVAIHIGEWGYLLSVLPALYVLAAALLAPLVRQARGAARLAVSVVAAACVAFAALAFLFLPEPRFSATGLRAHDRDLAAKVAYVREHFPSETTIILAREDYLHVRYYLGQYRTWYYDPASRPPSAQLHQETPQRTMTVVLFTTGLRPQRPQELRYATLAPDLALAYFVVEPGEVLEFSGTRFGVREPGER
jgi:4-amino-4-deoxy-L-arabinose transferase-like glycosyltransferase